MAGVTTPAPPAGDPEIPIADEPRSRHGTLVAVAVAALGLLAMAVGFALTGAADSRGGDAAETGPWKGVLDPNARTRPSFTLTDTDGKTFDFAAETAGELTILFFGYTSCPDICPVTMATLSEALDRVPIDATVVFVTTDPERDTPERIRRWLDGYDRSFIGLTGTPAAVADAQAAAGVPGAVAEVVDGEGGYTVSHATQATLYTEDDLGHLIYGFGTRLEDWVADLDRLTEGHDWRIPG